MKHLSFDSLSDELRYYCTLLY